MDTKTTTLSVPMDDENILERVPTGSSLVIIDEDAELSDEHAHKQDWSVTTEEKDSWANRERRRSSVWAKLDTNAPKTPASPGSMKSAGRRGSILSIWTAGKDKDGRDILIHDNESESDREEEVPLEKTMSRESEGSQGKRNSRTADRRGSILSLWSQGKDSNGRNVILHEDEEWNK